MTNHLAKEASPYLQMHAENPVDWYPWSMQALKKAEEEDKPILLSIGYTACHWCHVMAHESFEDKQTADIMNSLFINIKVDREERPDLDKIYQLSAQLLTRQVGGWPLTIFLMPYNHIPFFAGTYFPKTRRKNYPSFHEVLQYANMIFQQHRLELNQQNISFQNILNELESQAKIQAPSINTRPIEKGKMLLEGGHDPIHGGFGKAPKFPMTTSLEFLQLFATHDPSTKKMVILTLKKMHQGGIFDQVGGGFFRYTIDEAWQIPHFEKMLYDNALLLSLYSEAYSHNHSIENDFLREAIISTGNWLMLEMQSSEGGYYSSLAADSEGEEGKFYVWSKDELKSILETDEYEVISSYYGLNKNPNFKKSWHLQVQTSHEEIAKQRHSNINLNKIIERANAKLYQARSNKRRPMRDEKIIVSWNGLTIKGMALAGLLLNQPKYIESAEKCITFIMKNLWRENKLYSVYKDNQIKQLANIDDYTFLIEGIIFFLQSKWNINYFNFLSELTYNLKYFEDHEAGGFFFTSQHHEKLIYRLKQYTDESVPSSNAICTRLLMQIGYLLGDTSLLLSAERSLKNAFQHIEQHPDSYCSFLSALAYYFSPSQIIIVRGMSESLQAWRNVYIENYQPNRVIFFIPNEEEIPAPLNLKKCDGEAVAYFCIGHECLAPIKTMQDFQYELRRNQFTIKS